VSHASIIMEVHAYQQFVYVTHRLIDVEIHNTNY